MSNHYGVDRKYIRRKHSRSFTAPIMFVVLLAISIGVGYSWLHHKPKPVVPPATPTLTQSQQQANDVTAVGGAIGQYVAANGSLPSRLTTVNGSIVMCGTTCDSINSQINQLSTYQPSGVQIKQFAANLTVPDVGTMYLVPGATCKDKNSIGQPSDQVNAMVILYGNKSGTSLAQHCIKL